MSLAEEPIASVEEYNDAKIIVSSPNDTLYDEAQKRLFLQYASDFLESQCYQPLRVHTYEGVTAEYATLGTLYCSVGSNGWLNVFPRRFPIVEVTLLAYRTNPTYTFTEFETDTYTVNDQGRVLVPYASPLRPAQYAEVKIEYTAGYADEDMPGDVKYAVILIAAAYMSAGYAATEINEDEARQIIPKWAWKTVDAVINRYGRQF